MVLGMVFTKILLKVKDIIGYESDQCILCVENTTIFILLLPSTGISANIVDPD